jgi:hypothetical protein
MLLVVTVVAAPVADRLISNKILPIGTTRKLFNSIGNLVPAVTLFALGFVDGTQQDLTLALLVLAVGATGLIGSGSVVNLIDLAPNHAGTLFGIANGTSTICSILGPLTVQFLGTDKVKKSIFFQQSLNETVPDRSSFMEESVLVGRSVLRLWWCLFCDFFLGRGTAVERRKGKCHRREREGKRKVLTWL